MSIAAFDTYAAAKKLREAGFDERQAEAAISMVRDAFTEGVATKAEIARLEAKVDNGFVGLETATKAEIARLETATNAEIARLEAKVDNGFVGLETATKAEIARLETATNAEIARLETVIERAVNRMLLAVVAVGGLVIAVGGLVVAGFQLLK